MDAAGMTGADWLPWRAFWKSVYALPMTPDELAIYQRHTKRDAPPAEPVDEAWMCIGRGAGKTRNAALHAVFRAITFDSSTVADGESVTVPLLASDRDQAGAALKYVRGFNSLSIVAPYVNRGDLSSKAEYKTGVDVTITTASFRAPRGRTSPTACCDEIAFWSDEGANPDHEIVLAVRGTLGRSPGSVLLVLSNPYAARGQLYEAHESYFGRDKESVDDGVLVWNASTLSMRPSHPLRPIKRLEKADAAKAASEYGTEAGYVQFRQHEDSPFAIDAVDAVIVSGRFQLPPIDGVGYTAFLDAAQGQGSRSGSSMTLGIAHREGAAIAVLDLLEEVQPPFDPATVLRERFVPLLRRYGCTTVMGDRVSEGFVASLLAAEGIKFATGRLDDRKDELVSGWLDKSRLFGELLLLVNSQVVQLLDNRTLRTQLLSLQRKATQGGKDVFVAPRGGGGRDDVANAAAGALVHATGIAKKKKQVICSFGDGQHIGLDDGPRNVHDELRRLAQRTIAGLEAEDRADRERIRREENEPVWKPVGS